MFCKKDVLRNFAKFAGKHLCQRLFFNKVVGLGAATLLKKSLWHRCFRVNFAKFLRAPFSTELRWLLLVNLMTTPCIKHVTTLMLLSRLRISAKKLFKCFKYNQIKDNTEKCHLMLSAGDSNQIQIGNSLIKGSLCEKILCVKFDDKLTFD